MLEHENPLLLGSRLIGVTHTQGYCSHNEIETAGPLHSHDHGTIIVQS